MQATIVIVTKDRKAELRAALDSSLAQTVRPDILVIDDGSSDGTSQFVTSNYPQVRLIRSEISQGYIAQRNSAAKWVKSEVIVSIDDDAMFSREDIVEKVLQEFGDPRVVAVAIPFVDVNVDPSIRQRAPDSSGIWLTNEFIGTAYALRRDAFQKLGGYREMLVHQGEEGDLCIRFLEQGHFVRLGSSAPIHHFESMKRSLQRMNFYGQRNLVLFAWHNVPFPEVVAHVVLSTAKGLIWGLNHRSFGFRLEGFLAGLRAALGEWRNRMPVSRRTYWLYRKLKSRGPLSLADIQSRLAGTKL